MGRGESPLAMLRPDLIALSPDDLSAMANRGLVKRAQKEIESSDLTAQWTEGEDGTICAVWSDQVTCTLPGQKTLKDAKCTCSSLELCRHVLRTVLAWQRRQTDSVSGGKTEPAAPVAWDPGERITDALIDTQVIKTVRDRASTLWSQGLLAELLRSDKPSARFHYPGHTVRFPVPDDIRYARCSCSDQAPCVHAVLAVRAFRLLPPDMSSGIVTEGPVVKPVPPEPLHAAEGCVRDLLTDGLASLSTAWRDRVRRISTECDEATLAWPAQILEELAEDFDHYSARDAAFNPAQTARRSGELLLRIDAILSGCAPVPQPFIRGMKSDRDTELGAARFIGLGAMVTETLSSSTISVFLQDCDNGYVLALTRSFAEDPESATPRKPFHQLARTTAVKDASLSLLASGQLITQGGRRTAVGRLVIGRARAVVNPQNYAWEQLKAPVLVEDFAELSARLRLLPPASFRSRRAAADFHVCPIQSVEQAAFDPKTNSVIALLCDPSGRHAFMSHPWSERGQTGAEALLAALSSGSKPLFVAGHMRTAGSKLLIHPTAVVFAGESTSRRCVLPWLDVSAESAPKRTTTSGLGHSAHSRYNAAELLAADLILNGLRRSRSRHWPGWARAIHETEELGCHRMTAILRQVQSESEDTRSVLGMLKLLALAHDVG